MAKRIEHLSYPDKILDVMKDREMMLALTKSFSSNEYPFRDMLRFLNCPPKPAEVYDQYLAPNASYQVYMSGSVKKQTRDLLRNGDAGNPKLWTGIIQLMISDFAKRFDEKILPVFFTRREFLEFHETRAVAQANRKMGSPWKVANLPGIEKNNRLHEELMTASAVVRGAETTKLTEN